MGLVPWGGSCEGGKVFTHLETPSQTGTRGALEPQRGVQQQVHRRQSTENLAQRSMPTGISQQRSCLDTHHRESGLGAEAQALGVRPQGEDWGWLLWRTGVDSASLCTMQVRESRGKPGSAKKARDHCQRDPQTPGDPLTPHVPSLQDPAFTSGMSWLWSMTPEMGTHANMGFSLGVLSVCSFFY